jgi:hypothetical protein
MPADPAFMAGRCEEVVKKKGNGGEKWVGVQ